LSVGETRTTRCVSGTPADDRSPNLSPTDVRPADSAPTVLRSLPSPASVPGTIVGCNDAGHLARAPLPAGRRYSKMFLKPSFPGFGWFFPGATDGHRAG
jgi:hypothetical protein